MSAMSKLRFATYAAGIVAGMAATWAASQGLGTYDPETGIFDLAPFRVDALVLTVVTTAGNALAAVALWRGWGK